MGDVHDRLRELGIQLAVSDSSPEVRTQCTLIARQLKRDQRKLVGLMPAGANVAVVSVAIQLGNALADISGSPIGVVDANGVWPNLGSGDASAPGANLFQTSWLMGTLALLTPRSLEIGGMLPRLARAVNDEAAVFGHLVVDLTGFDRIGEHGAAMAMVDGVITVARAGRTTEDELLRWQREVPEGRNLGVLLTGT